MFIKRGRCKLIDRCKLESNDAGIYIDTIDEVTITNCEAYYNLFGIEIIACKNILFDHCNLKNNYFDGIAVYLTYILTVSNCNLFDNGDTIFILPEKRHFTILKASINNFYESRSGREMYAPRTFGTVKNNFWAYSTNLLDTLIPLYAVLFHWPYPYLKEPNLEAGPQ